VPGHSRGAHLRADARAGRIKVYRYALTWQVTAFMGLQSLLYYAALSWLPTIFQDRGSSAVTAGNLLALMGVGNLATSLIVPVLAHRAARPARPGRAQHGRDRRRPGRIALGAAGPGPLWVLVLGGQPGLLPRAGHLLHDGAGPESGRGGLAFRLSQSVGYLVASAGPLEVGLLHTATGSWDIPLGCCSCSRL
jgi:CP family cyanate transporter-like MFS transporter